MDTSLRFDGWKRTWVLRLADLGTGAITLLAAVASSPAVAVTLPVPCIASSCGAGGPNTFVTSGTANAQQSGSTLAINNLSNSAVLNWSSFNISADGKVIFQQPGASSIALNRIYQESPSSIFGSISANGQIYLVNPNGFIFGSTATVNVGGLLASSLNISPAVFAQGILSPALLQGAQPTPALASDGRTAVLDNNGVPVLGSDGKPQPIQILIEQGADLKAAAGGRLLLASANISNAGSLSAPDGQIVLAAGAKAYLQASTDPALRGIVVEVDSGGTAWNQLTGSLSAPRGNVSLVGLAVNQDGRISATTSVSANGSVSLVAADTTFVGTDATNHPILVPQNGGHLELGPQSSVQVLPELDSAATAVADQPQLQSSVALLGKQVVIHGGAEVIAPGGTVSAKALANPHNGLSSGNTDSQLRVDSGAVIDVSGSDAELPMSANVVAVQLNANELADDPANRDGFLHGKTVYVDARVGTKVANVSGAIASTPQTVAQRTSAGGQVSLVSEGDAVVATGSSINVSGGHITYDSGVIATTRLVASNGKSYDIGTADPNLTYVGLINPSNTQNYSGWGVSAQIPTVGSSHFETGYVQGSPAGVIQVAAPTVVLNGTLLGKAYSGPFQRTATTRNPGGQLIIGLSATSNPDHVIGDYLAPAVQFASQAPAVVAEDGAPIIGLTTLKLPTSYLSDGGFTDTLIYSNKSIDIPAGVPINIAPGGSLQLNAPRIDIASSVTAPSGKLQFSSIDTLDSGSASAVRNGISFAPGVSLDAAGLWTNDLTGVGGPQATGLTAQDGGTIAVNLLATNGELVLGDGSNLHASGGGWLSANGKITGGKGGSIAINAGTFNSALQVGTGVGLDAFGVAGAAGGSLALTSSRLEIAQGDGTGWTKAQRVDEQTDPGSAFQLYAPLFSAYGFSNISLTASGPRATTDIGPNVLTVDPGVSIVARQTSLALSNNYWTRPTGTAIRSFAAATLLPDNTRPVENVSFAFQPQTSPNPDGQIFFGAGASLTVDPTAIISISSAGSIEMRGTLRALGGQIHLSIPNPQSETVGDPGFIANQGIYLESTAVLDAGGSSIYKPSDLGLKLGSMLDGGTVTLLANRGSVSAAAGSIINVSGFSGPLDVISAVGTCVRQSVGSAGGTVEIRAPESLSLLGAMQAAAGSGGRAPGGTLSIELTRGHDFGVNQSVIPGFPSGPRVIEISNSPTTVGLPNGLAVLSAPMLESSGAAALLLQVGDYGSIGTGGATIKIDSDVSLGFSRSLVLDAPAIAVVGSGTAKLTAPVVTLTNSGANVSNAVTTSGEGQLNVKGDFIDLAGSVVLQGISQATFASSGDLRLDGLFYANGSQYVGALSAAGDLSLDAARIYPSTLSSFTIATSGQVSLGQTNASPGTPLSAGGSLTIQADRITNAGSVYAPFGEITLQATSELTLAGGSITSVSGNGVLVPFGSVQNGTEWTYGLGGTPTNINAVPTRQVSLNSASVDISKSATVDLSGGGDLYAYEWVPGTGGKTDALSATQNPGLYAILPQLVGQMAPYDPLEFPGSGLTTGASVYLSGVPGLATGVYPLLPARYALLPGAVLVQELPGTQGTIAPGLTRVTSNGTPVTAGYLTFGNTGLGDPLYSGFAIYPSGYGRQLSSYTDSYASSFFAASAVAQGTAPGSLPADAGRLLISASTQVALAGSVLSKPAKGGVAADVEIDAANIDIVANESSAIADGSVRVAADAVDSWGAGKLLIGGQRRPDGTTIDVAADTINVESGVTLSAAEVMLVAGSSIDVHSGATVAAASGLDPTLAPAALPAAAPVTLNSPSGGGALLAVSDLSMPVISSAAGSPASAAMINVEAGAAIKSRGATAIEGPGAVNLDGTLSVAGGAISLGSNEIRFENTPSSTGGLSIGSNVLASLESAQAVRLAATGAIEVFDNPTLGTDSTGAAPVLGSLTLAASTIKAANPGVNAVFGAHVLTLEGYASSAAALPDRGSGQLNFVADSMNVSGNTLFADGFAATNARISGALTGKGQGGLLVGGDMSLTAGTITAATGSQLTLSATQGLMTLTNSGSGTPIDAPASLGSVVQLNAQAIRDDASIVAPSGNVIIASTSDLTLGPHALIDTAGRTVTAAGKQMSSPGGSVTLSAGGNLSLAQSAGIDVSGATGADSGSIDLSAGGLASVGAVLSGVASSGGIGGSFALNAGQLAGPLDALAAQLRTGGFTSAQSIEVHAGDLDLSAGQSMTANKVQLVADSGSIRVGGTITAPAADLRGSIGLFAAQNVELQSTGALHADSAGERGGDIQLGTVAGQLLLDSGGLVSATGSQQKGTLTLRAPATGNDVAIGAIGADVAQVGEVRIEPVLVTQLPTNTLDGAQFGTIAATVAAYMSTAAPAIASRLAVSSATPVTIEPAVELRASADLTITDPLDLSTSAWRFNGQPVDLTIRAAGSLNVNASLSDGVHVGTNHKTDLLQGPSSSFTLVAGADLSGANPLAVSTAVPADLNIAAGTLIRTGTGNISLAASEDLVFAGAGASVYTTGTPGTPKQTLSGRFTFLFPDEGGDVSMRAGRDVVGSPISQSVSDWQTRKGSARTPVEWGVDVDRFDLYGYNVATLGGGDLSIAAGGAVRDISAGAADSFAQVNGQALHFGGGSLKVTAGGDIDSGQFYVGRGSGTIRAGGSLGSDRTDASGAVGSLISMGDARISITARGDVLLDGAINPTTIAQPDVLSSPAVYFSYGENSSLSVTSVGGDLAFDLQGPHLETLLGQNQADLTATESGFAAPPSLAAAALVGSVAIQDQTVTLYPSSAGQLSLFAGKDLIAANSGAGFLMSDSPLGTYASVDTPSGSGVNITDGAAGARHSGDTEPVSIYAGRDLSGLRLDLPKSAEVVAGRDILNLSLAAQNLSPTDVTLVSAGRDFVEAPDQTSNRVAVGGPGALDLLAGRNINLGYSQGVFTTGRLADADLPYAQGADINAWAGIGKAPDVGGFISAVVSPSSTLQQSLITFVSNASGHSEPSFAQAQTDFLALPFTAQEPFVVNTFMAELLASGHEASDPKIGYSRGYAAIDALFPGSRGAAASGTPNPYSGDLTLPFSRIYTLADGTIDLLAPGGLINVGLANPPPSVGQRPASLLGIVAQGAGDVRAYTSGDVDVNGSRIFTLGGGNIQIWSDEGNIDAGRGSKTAISAPPPQVLVDSSGNVTLDFSGAVAGSGIRTIVTQPSQNPGNVDLVAPEGTVNAGDAGIGAAGNLYVAAAHVIVGNGGFTAGGTQTGVPPSVSGLGASLSGAAGAATSSTNASNNAVIGESASKESAAPLASSALSWLDVFVEGFGEESCKSSDIECLKRNAKP